MRITLVIILWSSHILLYGQVIDNTASYRNISSLRYFRIHYENDYFSKTDEFYTQGMNYEYVDPRIAKFPLSHLVFRSSKAQVKNGISIEHIGFTPSSIRHPEILYGDRPFAAAAYLKTFSVLNDTLRKIRLSCVLSTGIIGPAALGEQIQKRIHKWIGDKQPLGWQNQIQNDVVFNYQVDIEKNLISFRQLLMINTKAGAMAGTLYDKIYGSTIIMIGFFENPFKSFISSKNKYQIYLYAEPKINLIGYDASLQGGIFNHRSPYIISSRDINRIVFQNNAGMVVKINRLNLEYFQSYLSQEFRSKGSHHWGGIRIGYSF
jgi:lipid A 3-O-deacylase